MLRTPPSDIHTFTRREVADLGIETSTAGSIGDQVPVDGNEQTVAAIDPATVAGSQSLLLEAQDNGTTGAVPFSGTVEWSKGLDENGQPTLVGKANIPARNLQVEVLIRKNANAGLPASHLMEINLTVSDSFIGGSIAGLPGVLLKDEELTQGTPLVGASARVVGNSFLFALSAAPEDSVTNVNPLTARKWIDLALVYASGKRAIITLEKDDKAQRLFSDVFAAWASNKVSVPPGLTVVPKNTTADQADVGRTERILTVKESTNLADILKKNGFTQQMINAIGAVLRDGYPDPVLPAHARLRILFGPSRTSDTLIPYRLSIYVHDDASNTDKHAATVALSDRSTYVLGLPPSPIDNEVNDNTHSDRTSPNRWAI